MSRALTDLAWPRRTERLLLRPPLLQDMHAVHAYRSDPATTYWLSAVATSVEEVAATLLDGVRGLVVEHDGEVVGDLMLSVRDGWAQREAAERARGTQAELGWAVAPAHRGQGYGTEAVRELVTIAFELGVRRVEANCFAGNHASRRVMEKVGLRLEAHFVREGLHRELGWSDSLCFGLLADEWDSSARQVRSGG
ncbi:GNAT family N-acetyltransferase [Ornithinimicrobium pekingense]|uniref:N-acetyltransferase n=1 Tax=Ornithinimicrobium pekingense TaxID=384677 RepID=A0ABQ2F9A3_9MICO|nr:GNAT family protein [Ornithinimicrobium pekingense]GGK73305.1 N-acetyltransferase [Ornithinimicrobium pekingense]